MLIAPFVVDKNTNIKKSHLRVHKLLSLILDKKQNQLAKIVQLFLFQSLSYYIENAKSE